MIACIKKYIPFSFYMSYNIGVINNVYPTMPNTQIDIEEFIKSIESMEFNSEKDVEMLKALNEAVESMIAYTMTLNLSNNK